VAARRPAIVGQQLSRHRQRQGTIGRLDDGHEQQLFVRFVFALIIIEQ
jgi:hypothetical protein